MAMDLSTLKVLLQRSWTRETSYDPANWSPSNPAWGQCAITALLVQDHFGGDILFTHAELSGGDRILHFYNWLGGKHGAVDLTQEQFPEGTTIPEGTSDAPGYSTTRDYILAYENTVRRYERLKDTLVRNLARSEEKGAVPSRSQQSTAR